MSQHGVTRKLTLAILSVAIVGLACSRATSAEDADRPTAVVVYGDRDNGFALATLLLDVDIPCKPVPYSDVNADWTTDADLVVFASCCPGGWQQDTVWNASLLDRLRDSRVIACGDTGASLLQTKTLLVGHPNGAHWPNLVAGAQITRSELHGALATLLDKPNQFPVADGEPTQLTLAEAVPEAGDPSSPSLTEHIGIYDSGTFPDGTQGIALMHNEAHHWIICRQGNFTLWGVDSLVAELTEDGRKLLANLCWHQAHAAPEPLVFPAKRFIEESVEGKLEGRSRGEYYHELARTGRLTIRLTWKGDSTMMLMTHQAFTQRVDGASPLTITQPINDAMHGRHVQIEVLSFDLPEGKECPYEVTLDWED